MTLREAWIYARRYLANRRLAYLRVFDRDNMDAQVVLADLANFCYVDRSTVDEKTLNAPERLTWVLEGRRQVMLRINKHLNLDEESLWKLYDGRPEPTERL